MRHVGERPERLALIPPSGWGRSGVGRLAWLLLCVFASLASVTAAQPGDAPLSHLPRLEARMAAPRLMLDWRDSRLSISARASAWEEVLGELERHTGVQIRVKGPLAGTLPQAFEELPLEQGLRRLFRQVNTVFLYASAPHAQTVAAPLREVWLVPKDDGAAARTLPSAGELAGTALPARPDPQQDALARGLPQEEPSAAGEAEEDEEDEAGTEQK